MDLPQFAYHPGRFQFGRRVYFWKSDHLEASMLMRFQRMTQGMLATDISGLGLPARTDSIRYHGFVLEASGFATALWLLAST